MSHPDPLAGGAPNPAEAAAPAPNLETGRLAQLERENADLKDRLLRALAEMENLRRRAERDVQDQRAYAITKFAGDMIGSADNLRRALDFLPKPDGERDDAAHAAFRPLIDGVELTERELLKALDRHGVKKREPIGEKFDPHKDQAVFEIPDENVPSGTVMQVMQPGYLIGERVLRPSMVGVSKGGPLRQPESQASASASEAKPEQEARPRVDKRA